MPVVNGVIQADTGGMTARAWQVGAFAASRIEGHPVAWATLDRPGPFTLDVPDGAWHIHAVASEGFGEAFASAVAYGSHGGIYGYGRPVTVAGQPVEGLTVHVSPLWRDLATVPNQVQPGITDEHRSVADAVIDRLAANLRSKVEDDLGPAVGLTRTRLSALFKRATGRTMAEYRTRLRLEAAKALLVETDLDILAVALEVGYDSPAQLSRMFARYIGVCPTDFRRLARAGLTASTPAPRPASLLDSALLRLKRSGATVRGEVTYGGIQRGRIIYVGAFTGVFADTYPLAWAALPAPGAFTLRHVPPGRYYLLACYCHRRMRYPGDLPTAFAYGGHGGAAASAAADWAPQPVECHGNEQLDGCTIALVDGDLAARTARPWWNSFLPSGR